MFTRLALIITLAASAPAAEWFVAPDGSDRSPGTRAQPFASVRRAQAAATAGDSVILRGGIYRMEESMITRRDRMWAYVILLDKSGSPGKPIRYRAADGEKPVFDFSRVKPAGMRVHAFQVSGSHLHLEGIAVTGVQVTATGHTQSICFSNSGSHNRYERLSMHDGMAIGFYLSRGKDNLVLNCDAWNNHDPVSGDRRGGNVDGFGGHPREGDTGNVFRNNLGYKARTEVTQLDESACKASGNLFGGDLSDRDFLSVDPAALTAPRKPDGSLPEIPLMHLAPAGKIVDRGVPLDLPFTGRAPDPGAYEAPAAAAAQ
jgi:hypothetical protein